MAGMRIATIAAHDRERLRHREDPRDLAAELGVERAPGEQPEEDDRNGDHDHRDAGEVLLERDEEALGDGDPERDFQPVLA